MSMFRELRADEIEVRVAEVFEGKGVTLLLYKDARCDMTILDETVGPGFWQRDHKLIGDVLYCSVGVFTGSTWVWKQDCGTSGNFEAEKSQASDSFKRACFNWGIGRELYTAPRIFVPADQVTIKRSNKGKATCYDTFEVAKVEMEEHVIKALAIRNTRTGKVVFTWVAKGYVPMKERKQA